MVCVFVGATAGIGYGTLRRMVTMLHSPAFYVLGRDEDKIADKLQHLRASVPTCNIVVIETQVSLISGIDQACEKIAALEQRLDFLCASPGGMPFQGAIYTSEGLEECFVVSYYSGMRLLYNLLPLLRKSLSLRVPSILNGTKEKRIIEDDLGLDKKWTIVSLVDHTTICTSLGFDYLAANDTNKQLTLLRATPGFVNTGTPRTTYPSTKNGFLWWAVVSVVQMVSGWIIVYFGHSLTESGEHHAFNLTSEVYLRGSHRANSQNEVVPDNEALVYYKEHGWMDKVWEHTLRKWDSALAHQSDGRE